MLHAWLMNRGDLGTLSAAILHVACSHLSQHRLPGSNYEAHFESAVYTGFPAVLVGFGKAQWVAISPNGALGKSQSLTWRVWGLASSPAIWGGD